MYTIILQDIQDSRCILAIRTIIKCQIGHFFRRARHLIEHFLMRELSAVHARRLVGDAGDAAHLHAHVVGGDHFMDRRHADDVGAKCARHADLGRRLV